MNPINPYVWSTFLNSAFPPESPNASRTRPNLGQLELIKLLGFDTDEILTSERAADVLRLALRRAEVGLLSPVELHVAFDALWVACKAGKAVGDEYARRLHAMRSITKTSSPLPEELLLRLRVAATGAVELPMAQPPAQPPEPKLPDLLEKARRVAKRPPTSAPSPAPATAPVTESSVAKALGDTFRAEGLSESDL